MQVDELNACRLKSCSATVSDQQEVLRYELYRIHGLSNLRSVFTTHNLQPPPQPKLRQCSVIFNL